MRYGIDFGFSIDPLAFTAMQFDAKHENLYIFDEIIDSVRYALNDLITKRKLKVANKSMLGL